MLCEGLLFITEDYDGRRAGLGWTQCDVKVSPQTFLLWGKNSYKALPLFYIKW